MLECAIEFRIPEPYEFYEGYCAKQEAARAQELAEGRCELCEHYRPVPRHPEQGWCPVNEQFMEADDPAEECEDDYRPAY